MDDLLHALARQETSIPSSPVHTIGNRKTQPPGNRVRQNGVATMQKTVLTGLIVMCSLVLTSSPILSQTPQDELEKRLEAIDVTDPDQLFEVGDWARKHKDSKIRREGRKLLTEILELDPEHEDAHKALGHVQFEDQWFTSVKKRDAFARKAMKEQMEADGYVWHAKGKNKGWIKKDQRRAWTKEWELDEGSIWRSKDYIMEQKGYIKYQDYWLKIGPEDRKRMERHRENTGDDIIVCSTPHFVMHLMVPPKPMVEYTEMVEKIYEWFMTEMRIPSPRRDNFFGRKVHVWSFRNEQQFQDWITEYAEEYNLKDEDKKQLREHPGGWLIPNKRLCTTVQKKAEDVKNPLAHQLGSILATFHTMGKGGAWQREAFGHLAEELFADIGRVNMSSLSRYANAGGVAEKDFNTKDGRFTAKGIARAHEERPLTELAKVDINSLTGSDLAQGFSLLEWMYEKERDGLLKFLDTFAKSNPKKGQNMSEFLEQTTAEAARKSFSSSPEEVMEKWRAFAKKYK